MVDYLCICLIKLPGTQSNDKFLTYNEILTTLFIQPIYRYKFFIFCRELHCVSSQTISTVIKNKKDADVM